MNIFNVDPWFIVLAVVISQPIVYIPLIVGLACAGLWFARIHLSPPRP